MHAVYTDAPGADTPKTDPKDYVFAGVMSCINASYDDMTAEPGYIIILPPFQVRGCDSARSRVTVYLFLIPARSLDWSWVCSFSCSFSFSCSCC